MLRTNELRQVPDMVIKIAMEWWQLVQSSPDESTQRARTAVLSYWIVTDPLHCADPKEEVADPTPQTSQ